MVRLGEYMTEFGRLLSNNSSVHFREVREGSTILAAEVDFEAVPKVDQRLKAAKFAEDGDALKVVSLINKMLRDDNAVGSVRSRENGEFRELLFFPGRDLPMPQTIGPFNEPASVKAKLVRVGGRDDTAHAQLIDAAGRIWNGKLSQQQAAEMAAKGLYKWFEVSGIARWIRTEEDKWELKDFRIETYSVLPEHSLSDEIISLRKIEGSEWGGVDPSEFIDRIRRDDDEVH